VAVADAVPQGAVAVPALTSHKYDIRHPATVENLVDWYKEHPELWNPGHPGYRLRREKDKVIADKAREIPMTFAHLKGWLQTKRALYVNLVQRLSGGAIAPLTEEEKWALDHLSFMGPTMRPYCTPRQPGRGPDKRPPPPPAPGPS